MLQTVEVALVRWHWWGGNILYFIKIFKEYIGKQSLTQTKRQKQRLSKVKHPFIKESEKKKKISVKERTGKVFQELVQHEQSSQIQKMKL